jgi:hypothetical protein
VGLKPLKAAASESEMSSSSSKMISNPTPQVDYVGGQNLRQSQVT